MLNKRLSYLQIALNGTLSEVKGVIGLLPASDRILIEAGTSFIKTYGIEGISFIDRLWSYKLGKKGYIVADLKCMDRGFTEVMAAKDSGAQAATCLGLAPIQTVNLFIEKCKELNIDSMIDMMNVEFPFGILEKLKQIPNIVVLHRGVEQLEVGNKEIPFLQIHKILETYDVLISVAGGETFKEVGGAIFNDANIAVVWKAFSENPSQTAKLAKTFLREIR